MIIGQAFSFSYMGDPSGSRENHFKRQQGLDAYYTNIGRNRQLAGCIPI